MEQALENSNIYAVLGVNKPSEGDLGISLLPDKAYEDDTTRK